MVLNSFIFIFFIISLFNIYLFFGLFFLCIISYFSKCKYRSGTGETERGADRGDKRKKSKTEMGGPKLAL